MVMMVFPTPFSRDIAATVVAGVFLGGLTTINPASAQSVNTPTSSSAASAREIKQDLPPEYAIGPDDQLSIVLWQEKEMSADVQVRPDGFISLPLINELKVSGLTPEQLRMTVTEAARRFVADPRVTVIVKQINSRKVFITGQVAKPGPYPLGGPTTVLQLIAMAGGVLEYADSKNVVVMRNEHGRQISFRFNYHDVSRRKNLAQNIELKPGDTVIVP